MIVIRNVFQIEPNGMKTVVEAMRESRTLFDGSGMKGVRVLTDLAAEFYTLVLEMEFESLTEYEAEGRRMDTEEWRKWYGRIRPHVRGGRREIYDVVEAM